MGEFIKSKRALLKPSDFALPSLGRRRAPGLRREEIAQVSGIGVTWYTWLEQGRNIRVSDDLLRRLARVLRLQPHETTYLYSLAGRNLTQYPAAGPRLAEGVQGVMDGFTRGPAFVLDLIGNVLAFNHIADFIYHFSDLEGPWDGNHLWRLFMDPYRRQLHVDWPDFARYVVGLMRGVFAIHDRDSTYHRLLADLHEASPDFRQMWKESIHRGTASLAPSPVHFYVPEVGYMNFVSVRFEFPTNDARAFFLTPIDEKTTTAVVGLALVEARHTSKSMGAESSRT